MTMTIDHLVVAATALGEGVAWVAERLGVAPAPGGRHADFGTHNALLGLGDCYLEVIAIDPDAPAPARPRWFGLDTLDLTAGPRLIHWVAADPDVAASETEEFSRGENHWRLTVPEDGSLPGGGVEPSRIRWLTPPPATSLPDRGLRLERLTLRAPDAAGLRARLTELGLVDSRVAVEPGELALDAVLATQRGPVSLT